MPRVPLNMPKMSMTMEFGTVEEWLVDVGGAVTDGDAVVVVTTDKVDMEVESTCDGTLVEILAQPGAEVPVGEPIAWIETEKDDLLGDLFAAPTARAGEADSAVPSDAVADDAIAAPEGEDEPAGDEADRGRTRAVPLARKLAAQAGLQLSGVEPAGPNRTIRARDVRAAIEARDRQPAQPASPPSAPSPDSKPPTPVARVAAAPTGEGATGRAGGDLLGDAKSRRLRVATAKVLESTALIPQFTVWRSLDLSRLAVARKASLAGVSWNTILLRGYALMLREYPSLNGSWAGDGVRANPHVGVALAIDTPTGLLAPVLRDPQDLGIQALNAAIKELAAAVKAGRADPSTMGGGTGTVSNLGSFGVQRFNALLTPPQATALSLGTVEVQPAFDADGSIRAKTVCEAGLTVDHRVADGADAARAFATMQEILNDPFLLLG
ncbi:dihydrolipoamide acetyltransferase family protein [Micropruina sonneratiae]|uniref:dihydrolipoamide acetyltransferase family protein n=1 Tax=Micropruina sonneratiae TaxID=2986940 RepID=UPI00222689E9|nr:dihydrolipoamide acetyltransferase family protein [Micropruina sp. KQZ13P-5]